ncbi:MULTISPECIES: aminotransferase class IV family protein [unclassified Ruegeria]|uniref:aminotransferase class IV family protein n=1 Tax=unclassified Ruegeria TaxID=2625375 RepID=UPI001ADB8E2B|nr:MULTISPECIES: aminotransferase class IV family protein [unclassified Ruegeria]MBO9411104.1 aminotransferase class IV family protein [Ruegeria sp. R8_1]MBO9415305.1 aminotransferase class IV family protein [Ruegeria sp. R8_2]
MESPLRPPDDPDFRLIETLAFRPGQGFVRRDRHLARMARSAAVLGLSFDRDRAVAALERVTSPSPLRCRLTLDTAGAVEVTTGALAENPPLWRVAIADQRLRASDIWLQHKTTQRALYDDARASLPPGIDELLFLNERDEMCEGTITNLFVHMADGRRLTPALFSGVLPGILREELLDRKSVIQATLTLTDLRNAEKIFVGNSLRGLIRAELVSE